VKVSEFKSSNETSIQYTNPTWTGDGFAEDAPQKLWLRLPELLRKIALDELSRGNETAAVLENQRRNIVLLSFKKGPLVDRKSDGSFCIHTSHAYGNYCYDGTKATYEDMESGCFLAFSDPDYKDPF
jgi:hypothetical protein